MKLWLLRPFSDEEGEPVYPFDDYDCAVGFVVRARTEQRARELATAEAGHEKVPMPDAWLLASHATCIPLPSRGKEGVIMRDFNAG